MDTDANMKFAEEDWYFKDILRLTLELYKCEHISDRKGVTEIIKIINSFITNSVLRKIGEGVKNLQPTVVTPGDDVFAGIRAAKSENFPSLKNFIDDVDLILFENKDPFKNVLTEEQRFAVYRDKCDFIDPISFTAGLLDNRIKLKAVHIPLEHQLKIFWEIPGVFNEMREYEKEINKLFKEHQMYSNFIHGALWQNYYKPIYEGRIVIPILIFFDDLESSNALGSHAGGQKFGCVYVFFPTLPPQWRSKLKNVLLTTIFYSENRKLSGNEVFQKLIEELNILSQQGTILLIDNQPVQVFFQCVGLLGDNLGLNQICGFQESFAADYYCRRCTLTSTL